VTRKGGEAEKSIISTDNAGRRNGAISSSALRADKRFSHGMLHQERARMRLLAGGQVKTCIAIEFDLQAGTPSFRLHCAQARGKEKNKIAARQRTKGGSSDFLG
jgi:hypothetical protein